MSRQKLTGKQASFVDHYLGDARFNATVAAKMAGYRATSKHSFEAIGSENLTRPGIRAAIDDYFKLSRMSAEEVLIELTSLARGNGKDQIRALALLSQHHGLLDGRHEKTVAAQAITIQAEYDRGWDACVQALNEDVDKYNAEAEASNKRKEAQWQEVIDRYQHSPEAVEALTLLRDVMLKGKELEPREQDYKIIKHEIIPPERRLEPAPVEKLMAEVIEVEVIEQEPAVLRTYVGTLETEPKLEPELCPHGCALADCYNCRNFGEDYIDVTTNERGERVYKFGQAARQQR